MLPTTLTRHGLLQMGSHFNVSAPFLQRRFATGGVVPYREEYYSAVRKIAMDNLDRLGNGVASEEETSECFAGLECLLLQKENCFVSLVGDTPVAFLTYTKVPKTFKTLWKDYAKVEQLATDSAWRKHGHGSALLTLALEKFEKEGAQFATLQINDLSLLDYYKKFGFQSVWKYSSPYNTLAHLTVKLGPPAESVTARAVDAVVMRAKPHIDFLQFYGECFYGLRWHAAACYVLSVGLATIGDHRRKSVEQTDADKVATLPKSEVSLRGEDLYA